MSFLFSVNIARKWTRAASEHRSNVDAQGTTASETGTPSRDLGANWAGSLPEDFQLFADRCRSLQPIAQRARDAYGGYGAELRYAAAPRSSVQVVNLAQKHGQIGPKMLRYLQSNSAHFADTCSE